MASDFKTDVKKIDSRSWQEVKGKWLAHIPNIHEPGEIPSSQISDIINLTDIYSKAKNAGGCFSDEESINFRQEILREGIFYAHKAIHVCGAAIVHMNNGIMSWSISAAYQSGLFSLKSILNLFGLSFPRINYKSIMIDCFPTPEPLSKNQLKKGLYPKEIIKYCIFPELTHIHYWEIFQRLLRVCDIDIISEDTSNYIIKLDPRQFNQQRNSLHYINNYWIIRNDMFQRVFDDQFGVLDNLIPNIYSDDSIDKNDYTILLNYLLLKINIDLIKDIAFYSEEINEEYQLMINTLNEGIHNRFHLSIVL